MPERTCARAIANPGGPSYPRVGIVIVHWNNLRDTLSCLRSVASSEYEPVLVIVVNNGDTSLAQESLTGTLPAAVVLTSTENLGYAGGNNLGIRYALENGCDFVWLLNDDTTVAPDSLSSLMDVATREPEAGFLGPKVLMREDPRRILFAGGLLRDGWRPHYQAVGALDDGQIDVATEVDLVVGCALLAKRDAIEAVGTLDEDFFAYYEDVEWCYRGKQAGFRVIFVPEARVWHPDTGKRDENSALVTYYLARNSLLFVKKHRLGWLALTRLLGDYARTWLSWMLRPQWHSKRSQRDVLRKAVWDFARGRSGRCREQFLPAAKSD